MKPAGDDPRWGKVPARFYDDLERGDITLDGFALRAYLIGRTNHHTGEYAATVSAIADAVQWRKSDQQLRNELKKLAPDFDVEVNQGRRRPWIFRVVAKDMGLPVANFKRETPSDFEVTSNGRESENVQNQHRYADSNPPRLQTGAAPTDADADVDGDQDSASSSWADSAAAQRSEKERENIGGCVSEPPPSSRTHGGPVNEEKPWHRIDHILRKFPAG
ncbi:MAG: hypothetical protein H0V79_05225 [Actinobacteria bacterium]|nr:hypothetical protein [Actinomycetota bacterium]